jgi:hypothetical protein
MKHPFTIQRRYGKEGLAWDLLHDLSIRSRRERRRTRELSVGYESVHWTHDSCSSGAISYHDSHLKITLRQGGCLRRRSKQ